MRYFDPEKYALIENESILNKLAEREDRLRNKPDKDKLLEEYKDFLHFKASSYSKARLDYDDVFNQGYLFLLENYPQYSYSSTALRKKVDSCLRTYYNQEKEERHISYGIDPDSNKEVKERIIKYGINPSDINV